MPAGGKFTVSRAIRRSPARSYCAPTCRPAIASRHTGTDDDNVTVLRAL
jgi:hypothetical protein